MGRKKIKKMKEIIITKDGKIVKIPILNKIKEDATENNDEDYDDNDDNDDRLLLPINMDNPQKNNESNSDDEFFTPLDVDEILSEKNDKMNQKKTESLNKINKTSDPPSTIDKYDDFSSDIFGNATENQYIDFLNELDNLYFLMS